MRQTANSAGIGGRSIKHQQLSRLALLVFVFTPNLAFAQRVVPSERVRRSVTVFEQDDSDSPRVGQIRVGESAEHLGSIPRWHEVRLDNGLRGFVSKSWTRVISGGLSPRQQDELRIHHLNVGAGTCTLVECPGADAPPMIVDCGSLEATDADMDRDEARDYIQDILDDHAQAPNLVLSHADRDHYGWIPHVLRDTRVQHIWQGGDAGDYSSSGFPTWISRQGAKLHQDLDENWHNDGDEIGADLDCGAAAVFVLTVNTGSSKNANSLVLNIEYGDFVATFTGDAEGTTERAARENLDGAVKTTVLSGSHHGARTHSSNSQTWVNATAPEIVIFSAGRKFGHPQCDAVERFEASLAQATEHPAQCGEGSDYEPEFDTGLAQYMTEINGRIVITSNGQSPLFLICTGSKGCETQISH